MTAIITLDELSVPELYQLKKEVEEEVEELEEVSQTAESLLVDEVSVQSERSLTYNELINLTETEATNT